MEGVVHTTLLTSVLFLSSLLPQASSSAAITPLPIIGQESSHVVKENETLGDIAKIEYKDEEAVTVILSDNDWITDPNIIQPGWQLKIRKNPLLNVIDPTVLLSTVSTSEKEASDIASLPKVQAFTAIATPTPSSPPSITSLPSPTSLPISSYAGGPLNTEQIQYLGSCEAGMDTTRNTGNGYYGAFQFSYGTWQNMGTGYERADLAPLDVQIQAVQNLLSRSSIFTQFPACARKMQADGIL